MPHSYRTALALAASYILFLSPAALLAQDFTSARPVVEVASRDSELKRMDNHTHHHQHQHEPALANSTEAGMDPYGFAAVINTYRARAGLHPLAYDPNLSAWAGQNNAACSSRGLGHHVVPNCRQNCAWNYANPADVAIGWMNSSGHRANMLAPDVTRFGIAYGPGPYWTMNAR